MRKFIYTCLLLVSFLASHAQTAVGDWRIHGLFSSNVKTVIDTHSKVYFLVDGWLYCYDKDNDETISLSEEAHLNDVTISDIYFNHDSQSLYIVYANSNIDILHSDGTVVNMPDILNASLSVSKKINDIAFSEHGTFVATDFGYVRFNDKKNEVKESRIYNASVYSLCVVGDYLVLNTDSRFYLEVIDKHYSSLSEAISVSINQKGKIHSLSHNEFLLETGWLITLKIKDNDLHYGILISNNGSKNLQRVKDGYQFSDNDGFYHRVNDKASKTFSVALPQSMRSSLLSAYNDSTALWQLSPEGLRHVSINDDGGETILTDYICPDASTADVPYYMVFNETQGRLYVMNCGSNRYYSNYLRSGAICSYDGTSWRNELPSSFPTTNPKGQKNNSLNAPYDIVFHPEDASTYYVGTWYEGVYKVTDGNVVAKYDWTNSPLKKVEVDASFHICTTPCIKFDGEGNLWILQFNNPDNQFAVLPRDKQKKESVTFDDWLTPQVNGVVGDFRSHLFITSRNVKLHGIGDYNDPLTIFYDNDNPASSNIKSKVFSSLTDQDGKEYTWNYINCFVEDKRGRVWMGTNNGVVEMLPHNAITNSSFTINHLKVPRNDGTNLADYLLDNTDVTSIAVDGSNRKWIGTSTSGVLLVSEDGSEILQQFTTLNSPMLSNKVLSVCCNPTNNRVYIGTEKGIMEYASDSEPPAAQYDIYAFPNPVRPDFTGEITIRGLMENSLVKIADSVGNVVKSIRSTGGMATWDGCNSQGQPVKSGVYYILASENEDQSASGAVTKILIIR